MTLESPSGIRPLGGDSLSPAMLAHALSALEQGDFSVALPEGAPGTAGEIAAAFNRVVSLSRGLCEELSGLSAVGRERLPRAPVALDRARGSWAAAIEALNGLLEGLEQTARESTEQAWLKTNLERFTRMLQGERDLVTVARRILSELAPLVSAQQAAFYVAERDDGETTELSLLAGYALSSLATRRFRAGEGLVGQCLLERRKIVLRDVPEGYVPVRSGLGSAVPRSISILPLLFEGRVNAVIEIASLEQLSPVHDAFLDQLSETLGIVVDNIAAGMRTKKLLEQSQSLTHELQTQQEELRRTNERLQHQAETLRQSEERLMQQQEKLQTAHQELQEKAKLLEQKNREIEHAKVELEEKAEQLAATSKYKSEFLANMSHELRTPLNSLLILSKMLSENFEGNLTPKQVEFTSTIHAAGSDLLALINDVLDLSKVESGKLTIEPGEARLEEVRERIEQSFWHVARQKDLELLIEIDPTLPEAVVTDAKRLEQVLRNLLSNAFKFTERGRVLLAIRRAHFGWSLDHAVLDAAQLVVAFSVTDTGIGIPEDKQQVIFEAFQQADGTTSRRFGGTGLGLSICREIARLLGGEIRVVSQPGVGSTFTFYLPGTYVPVQEPPTNRPQSSPRHGEADSSAPAQYGSSSPSSFPSLDDRDRLQKSDRVLLVIESDLLLARMMVDAAHDAGLKAIVAPDGARGLGLLAHHVPTALALDLELPDISGLTLLDRLKHELRLRHVPVIVLGSEVSARRARTIGARAVLEKPPTAPAIGAALAALVRFADERPRRLLAAGAEPAGGERIAELLGGPEVDLLRVASPREALERLGGWPAHCLLLELGPPELAELAAVGQIGSTPWSRLPVVILAGRALSRAEQAELERLERSLVLKVARTTEELLDATAVFLHRSSASLRPEHRELLEELNRSVPELDGARILVVDDDLRNTFALTSALERHGAEVSYAETGRQGLALLDRAGDMDVVLVDLMMPEMDGYEVMSRMRSQERFRHLPIIAVTAKAMRGERHKCIAAGASDYIAKPVDMDQLLSLLRVSLSS